MSGKAGATTTLNDIARRTDTEYEDHIITKVDGPSESGSYGLSFRDLDDPPGYVGGGGCGTGPGCPVVPRVGDTLRLYGRGFGYSIRGMMINGIEVHYQTPEGDALRGALWSLEYKVGKAERFNDERPALMARVAALPRIFRDRLDRFAVANPLFWQDYGSYELFTCEEAAKIADVLKTDEAIVAWKDLPWDEQVKTVPIDDGHSGNTFGCAVALARQYIVAPENVPYRHGALVPLVGCEAYACEHPAVPE